MNFISEDSKKFSENAFNTEDAIITGYASKFDVIDTQNEIIKPNAFLFSDPKQIKLLWQHDYSKPIGFIESLIQDKIGLYVVAHIISDVQCGREAISLIKKNVLNGFSVGFQIAKQDFNFSGEKNILEAHLLEVSVVTFPANHHALINDITNESQYFKRKLSFYSNSLSKLENLLKKIS